MFLRLPEEDFFCFSIERNKKGHPKIRAKRGKIIPPARASSLEKKLAAPSSPTVRNKNPPGARRREFLRDTWKIFAKSKRAALTIPAPSNIESHSGVSIRPIPLTVPTLYPPASISSLQSLK